MSHSIAFNTSPPRSSFMDYTDDDCLSLTSAPNHSGFFKSASGLKMETEVTDYAKPKDTDPAQGLIVYNGHAGLGANQLLVLMADAGGQ